MTDSPNPFCSSLPTQLRAWDATSLRSYMRCPQRYKYEIVDGWRRDSVDTEWGRLYHAAVEEYDRAIARGEDRAEALDAAFAWLLANSRAWDSPDSKKNRYTLLRALVWYCDEQRDDGVRAYVFPNGRPAVELSFQLPLPLASPDGAPYLLCGHMDGIYQLGDEVGPRERKTTKNSLGPFYFAMYDPDIQIATYDLVYSVLFHDLPHGPVMLEATQTGAAFARFHRQFIHSTEGRRQEVLADILYWIKRAEDDARAGYYPKNLSACGANGGCPFRDVCSKDPSVRDRYLRGGFAQRHWNPLETR